MQQIKDSVINERNRLEAAFVALENAVELIARSNNGAAVTPAPNQNAEITEIQEIVQSHEQKIAALKEEIGKLSVDLVHLKNENRALKEQNASAVSLIDESITAIQKMVAA